MVWRDPHMLQRDPHGIRRDPPMAQRSSVRALCGHIAPTAANCRHHLWCYRFPALPPAPSLKTPRSCKPLSTCQAHEGVAATVRCLKLEMHMFRELIPLRCHSWGAVVALTFQFSCKGISFTSHTLSLFSPIAEFHPSVPLWQNAKSAAPTLLFRKQHRPGFKICKFLQICDRCSDLHGF